MPAYRIVVEVEWIDVYEGGDPQEAARAARDDVIEAIRDGSTGIYVVDPFEAEGETATLGCDDL